MNIIIWGHKLYSHTSSYVHAGFYKAFKYMGYDTFWFDDNDDVSSFDFSNCLFITEGQVDKKIPKIKGSLYLLHNCDINQYNNMVHLALAMYINPNKEDKKLFGYDDYAVTMCWATDLLPIEIDENKNYNDKSLDNIYWVGSKAGGIFGNIDDLNPFIEKAKTKGKNFIHSCPWTSPISFEQNLKLIRESFLAPTIVGTWQKNNGYVPCRIFKNISYGKIPLTNSPEIKRIFGDMVIFNDDTAQLFLDGEEKLNTINNYDMVEVIKYVKNNHTYVNRATLILEAFDLL